MKGAFDWLARTVIVALSIVATLSIIGSIAAIPSGSIEHRLGMDVVERAVDTEAAAPQQDSIAPPQDATPVSEMRPGDAPSAALPPPSPDDAQASWLEAITYALIAIAALLATITFVLWRALGQWRRLADAAERQL